MVFRWGQAEGWGDGVDGAGTAAVWVGVGVVAAGCGLRWRAGLEMKGRDAAVEGFR